MKTLLLQVLGFVMGPKDENGRIRPARPAMIIGVTVIVLVLLTWLTKGYIWLGVGIIALFAWLSIEARKDAIKEKKAKKIRQVLAVAQVSSTYEVSRHTGLGLAEVESMILEMINSANTGRKSRIESEQFLRNAQLDLVAHTVTLDPRASDNTLARLGAGANALLDRFAPVKAVPKPDWRCSYCRALNNGDSHHCAKCRASRSD